MGRRIVVDACIGRSAGGRRRPNEYSALCANTLHAIARSEHKAVVTPELLKEWMKNQSHYGSSWLAMMTNRRRVVNVSSEHRAWSSQLASCDLTTNECACAKKDFHLVVAARYTDKVVLSGDKKAQQIFASIAGDLIGMDTIAWVNPRLPEHDVLTWIAQGAKCEAVFHLSRTVVSNVS